MENIEHKNTCGCDCTMCHVGHHRRYRFLLIIIGTLLAFGVGMKIGEIKGYMMGEGYGPRPYRGMMLLRDEKGAILQQGAMPAPQTAVPTTTTPASVQ